MRYVVALLAMVTIGAGAWGIYVRGPSFFQLSWSQPSSSPKEEPETSPLDEGVSRTIATVEKILRNSPGRGYRTNKLIAADVTKVIDGDTIEVFVDGALMTVGYIGIEAPVLKTPVDGPEPFAVEALERNRDIVEGKVVMLERDLIDADRRGRRLRYVYVGDLMVNALLLHEGLARSDISSKGLKYAEVMYLVEQQAMLERQGGWRLTWPSISRRQ